VDLVVLELSGVVCRAGQGGAAGVERCAGRGSLDSGLWWGWNADVVSTALPVCVFEGRGGGGRVRGATTDHWGDGTCR
jgi:hypothetical protein